MPKTTINIKADKAVKEKAQKVARGLGMPLSTVINAYLNQFIRTREIYFYLDGELKPSARKRFARLRKEALAGKNLSPVFHNADKIDVYLNSLERCK